MKKIIFVKEFSMKKKCYKKNWILGLIFSLVFVACNAVDSPFGGNGESVYLDTPPQSFSGDFLSAEEQAVIDEMNFARTQPGKYLSERLQPFYDRVCAGDTGDYCTKYTKTAIEHMQEIVDGIENGTQESRQPFKVSLGLVLAARDFIADPGRNVHSSTSKGFEGHSKRIKNYLSFVSTTRSGSLGEIAWPTTISGDGVYKGDSKAENLVAGWIIDNGVPDYGHRLNLLGVNYRYVGLGFGYGSPDSEQDKYKNTPAIYAKLATEGYVDNTGDTYKDNYKDALPLHNGSITRVVAWPVLRYINGKYIEFDANGRRIGVKKAP